jgi:hypothetical protein
MRGEQLLRLILEKIHFPSCFLRDGTKAIRRLVRGHRQTLDTGDPRQPAARGLSHRHRPTDDTGCRAEPAGSVLTMSP